MTLRLRITARATREIERADVWWRENRQAAPAALRDDLRAAFQLLLLQPGIGVKVVSARLPGTRRLHLRRIRYFVFYRVSGDDLYILAIWHSSRGTTPSV